MLPSSACVVCPCWRSGGGAGKEDSDSDDDDPDKKKLEGQLAGEMSA